MTAAIFGPDISSFQSGLVLSRLMDASFVIAKTTEGTYYTDADYQGWRAQAAKLQKRFLWYHFLSGERAAAQAAHTAANVGDLALPGMLDAEPEGPYSPSLAQIVDYIDAAFAAGLNLRLLYLPRWYWERIGSPDLSEISARCVHLVSSQYPGGTGAPHTIYPGDGAAGWESYGGMTPLIYQFTNQASDGGQPLDYNAFKGTTAQFDAAMAPRVSTTTPTEDENMPAFATGTVEPGEGAVTVVLPPPANGGTARWGKVWFSLGCTNGDAGVHVVGYVDGQGWSHDYPSVVVPDHGDRFNPFGGPLPAGIQKIKITRTGNPTVPLAWLIEATTQ